MWHSEHRALPKNSNLPCAGSPGSLATRVRPCRNRRYATKACKLESSSVENAGIPAEGIPALMLWAMAASDRRCAAARVAMSGARSPPRPSKPWHAAQRFSNNCRPRASGCSASCAPVRSPGDVAVLDIKLRMNHPAQEIIPAAAKQARLAGCKVLEPWPIAMESRDTIQQPAAVVPDQPLRSNEISRPAGAGEKEVLKCARFRASGENP